MKWEWEHLKLTDAGQERMAEVESFIADLAKQQHPIAEMAREEFERRLAYLDDYGGPVSDDDHRRRFRVVLGRDWSPMSFSITWYRLVPATNEYVHAFNGGLIWHGGANDPLCISVTPCLFGIHT